LHLSPELIGILTVAAVALTGVLSLTGAWSNKSRALRILMVASAAVALISAIVSASNATRASQRAKLSEERELKAEAASASVTSQLEDLQSVVKARTDEAGSLSGIVAGLANKGLKEATGGDSFPVIDVGGDGATEGVIGILTTKGLNPLFGVEVRVVDADALAAALKSGDYSLAVQKQTEQKFSFPFLNKGSYARPLFTTGPVKSKKLNIFSSARNGDFTELALIRRVPQGWTTATIVSASYADKRVGIVYEHVDDSFPPAVLKADTDWQGLHALRKISVPIL
jgi:hypothetical protein